MDFTLKQLANFVVLAENGNFTKSAEQLHIAQSALSISIQKLEQVVGLKLINRSERKMKLTNDGLTFLTRARKILHEVDEAKREVRALKGLESGEISFGVPAMLGSYLFPNSLAKFKRLYPNVQVNIHEAGTATLENMVLMGELDLALVRSENSHEQMRYTTLIQDQVVACVATNHPFAKRSSITLQEFCGQPLVLFRDGYFLREAVNGFAQKHNLALDIRFETNLIELLKSMVKEEIGIGTCLPRILEDDSELNTIPFSPAIPLDLALSWKANLHPSTAVQAFVKFMVAEHAAT